MRRFIAVVALCLAGAPAFAVATGPLETAPPPERALPIAPTSKEFEEVRKMAQGHPNEIGRLNGLEAYALGRDSHARAEFQRAARFADKYSQARLALMHWYGEGGAADPVMAYVWADLAAERGYTGMLAIREEIWGKLTPDQQTRALEYGQQYYAEYGDAVAKKRMANALRRARSKTTGSRTGFVGFLSVMIPDGSGVNLGSSMGSNRGIGQFYAEYRWDPERYWQVEDAFFGKGEVEVGPLQKADAPASGNE
jgi:hypothetical protein